MRVGRTELALTVAAVAALGFLLKQGCAPDGWGGSAANYYRLCYTDVGPLYYVRGFADGIVPYLQQYEGRYLEYPVLIGFWMWLVATAVNSVGLGGAGFVYLTWLTSLAFAVGAATLMLGLRGRGARAWWFALSPALLLTLGINWDSLAVLAVVAAFYLWQHSRFGWVGAAIGIGAAAKLFPALLLVPMLALLVDRRQWRDATRLVVGAAAAWLAVNLPVFLASPDGWWEFYRFSQSRGIDFGSPWLALYYGAGVGVSTEQANLFGLVAVGVAVMLVWILRRRLDLFTASFLLIAVFTMVNKVYSPQFWLWLTPLAALAAVRLREFAIWQLAQLVYFVGIWRFLLHTTDPLAAGGIDERGYAAAIAVHLLATASLVVVSVVRRVRSPRPEASPSGSLQP